MKLFILSIVCVLVFSLPQPAQASYWIQCEIVAKVLEAKGDTYKIEVVSGKVIQGHENEGVQCLNVGDTYNVDLKDSGLNVSENITLIYDYYNAMGPDGVVESTEWLLPC